MDAKEFARKEIEGLREQITVKHRPHCNPNFNYHKYKRLGEDSLYCLRCGFERTSTKKQLA
jgi:hypothetical protein